MSSWRFFVVGERNKLRSSQDWATGTLAHEDRENTRVPVAHLEAWRPKFEARLYLKSFLLPTTTKATRWSLQIKWRQQLLIKPGRKSCPVPVKVWLWLCSHWAEDFNTCNVVTNREMWFCDKRPGKTNVPLVFLGVLSPLIEAIAAPSVCCRYPQPWRRLHTWRLVALWW